MEPDNAIYQFSRSGDVFARGTQEEAVDLWKKGSLKDADAYWRPGMHAWEPMAKLTPLLERLHREKESRKQEAIRSAQARYEAELRESQRKADPAYGPWRCLRCQSRFDIHDQIPGGIWPAIWSALLMFGAVVFVLIASALGTFTSGIGALGIGAASRDYDSAAALAGMGILMMVAAIIAVVFIYVTLLCLSVAHLINAGIAFANRRRHNGRRCPACLGSEIVKENQGAEMNSA